MEPIKCPNTVQLRSSPSTRAVVAPARKASRCGFGAGAGERRQVQAAAKHTLGVSVHADAEALT
jgi:hypothetical protein